MERRDVNSCTVKADHEGRTVVPPVHVEHAHQSHQNDRDRQGKKLTSISYREGTSDMNPLTW